MTDQALIFYRYVLLRRKSTCCQALHFSENSRSHSDTPHFVGLLWTSNQTVTESSTWIHTTPTRDRHPCPQRKLNLRSQQAS